MLNSFMVVGTQVLILFILIGLGVLGTKCRLITKEGVSTMTEIMLYLVTPCVMINAFQKDFDYSMFIGFLIACGSAVFAHVLAILLGKLFFKGQTADRKSVMRFAVIFSNCGFMSLPLLEALLGSDGVFYGASYVAVFNIMCWSYGLKIMDPECGKLSIKKILLNPGIDGVVIGLIFFFTSFHLPELILKPVQYMAALNTPVPMLIIGYYAAQLDVRSMLRDKDEYLVLLLRLVVTPLIVFGVLYALGIRGSLLVACVLSCSAPVAATGTMFSVKFGQDAKLSAELVALSTFISIITMTLIVGMVQYLA